MSRPSDFYNAKMFSECAKNIVVIISKKKTSEAKRILKPIKISNAAFNSVI